jgi:hypothetical protein
MPRRTRAHVSIVKESSSEGTYLAEVILVLSDLRKDFHAFLDDVLADDLQDLVLLQRFTRNVEWEILRIDNTLDEVEVLWDKILAVVHDEDTADIELDIVPLLLGLEEVKGSTRFDQQLLDQLKSLLTAWERKGWP